MEEQQKNNEVIQETVAPVKTTTSKSKQPWFAYGIAVLVVILILVGVVFMLEREGRINTSFFGEQAGIPAGKVVAVVNDVEIKGSEYNTSVSQITANAVQQQVDVSSEEAQTRIKDEAMQILINTELLKQEAGKRGITVTDQDVEDRIATLVTEIGSQEALDERMASLGITSAVLRRDIKSELFIQRLLEAEFAAQGTTVTDEEIQTAYDDAGGEAAGLPPLSEIKPDVEASLRAGKEQAIITTLLETLRSAATIETLL